MRLHQHQRGYFGWEHNGFSYSLLNFCEARTRMTMGTLIRPPKASYFILSKHGKRPNSSLL